MAKRILIIEDDTLLSRLYQTKFSAEGYEVLLAGDGEQGWEVAKTQKPDFVIMDVMMPKLSGMELLARVRQDQELKTVPVIMFSNLSQPEEVEQAKKLGANEFLLKGNYTPSQIVAKVKQYLP